MTYWLVPLVCLVTCALGWFAARRALIDSTSAAYEDGFRAYPSEMKTNPYAGLCASAWRWGWALAEARSEIARGKGVA